MSYYQRAIRRPQRGLPRRAGMGSYQFDVTDRRTGDSNTLTYPSLVDAQNTVASYAHLPNYQVSDIRTIADPDTTTPPSSGTGGDDGATNSDGSINVVTTDPAKVGTSTHGAGGIVIHYVADPNAQQSSGSGSGSGSGLQIPGIGAAATATYPLVLVFDDGTSTRVDNLAEATAALASAAVKTAYYAPTAPNAWHWPTIVPAGSSGGSGSSSSTSTGIPGWVLLAGAGALIWWLID